MKKAKLDIQALNVVSFNVQSEFLQGPPTTLDPVYTTSTAPEAGCLTVGTDYC